MPPEGFTSPLGSLRAGVPSRKLYHGGLRLLSPWTGAQSKERRVFSSKVGAQGKSLSCAPWQKKISLLQHRVWKEKKKKQTLYSLRKISVF